MGSLSDRRAEWSVLAVNEEVTFLQSVVGFAKECMLSAYLTNIACIQSNRFSPWFTFWYFLKLFGANSVNLQCEFHAYRSCKVLYWTPEHRETQLFESSNFACLSNKIRGLSTLEDDRHSIPSRRLVSFLDLLSFKSGPWKISIWD